MARKFFILVEGAVHAFAQLDRKKAVISHHLEVPFRLLNYSVCLNATRQGRRLCRPSITVNWFTASQSFVHTSEKSIRRTISHRAADCETPGSSAPATASPRAALCATPPPALPRECWDSTAAKPRATAPPAPPRQTNRSAAGSPGANCGSCPRS